MPILAASSAYAVGEALNWRIGLGRRPREARAFYTTLVSAMLIGLCINFSSIDPIKALFWTAILNGIIAVPLMFVMMRSGGFIKAHHGRLHTLPRTLKTIG